MWGYTVRMRRYLPKSTEELLEWWERYVAPFSLALGFIADYIAFQHLDLSAIAFALLGYLLIALGGITLLNFFETGRIPHPLLMRAAPFVPAIVQFSFGGLFGGFVILYSESAKLAATWVFVGLLAALLIGNERFRARYRQFPFQIGILFTALFAYCIVLGPLILGRIGRDVFLLGGVAAVLLVAVFLYILRYVLCDLVEREYVRAMRNVGVIFFIFSALYFTNAIPPLPLALRDAGVYHLVERVDSGYHTLAEDVPWYRDHWPFRKTYHRAPNEPVYVFSAVFAPTRFSTTITHGWERYDDDAGEWKKEGSFTFPIFGGRDEGYRGYSMKTSVPKGKWRVNVFGPNGERIGRVSFYVENVAEPTATEELVL